MFGRNEPQQHWSVHAEFTISHPGASDPDNLPQTNTEQGDNGVRMTYTWTSQAQSNHQNTSSWSTRSTPPPPPPSQSSSQPPQSSFQKGNLLFTSTPPPRRPFTLADRHHIGVQDSGYGSDLLSPNSIGGGGGCRRPIQPYNRKCRSTCNIVLSTNVQDENRTTEDKTDTILHTQCGRTQSLRCQTPTLRCDRKENYYGCGDPWCHHLHYGDDFSCTGRFSPVMETCEDTLSNNSGQTSKTNTTVRCCDHYRTSSSLPPLEIETRKDACVQTFEMIDKCTSPYLKIDNFGQKYEKNQQDKDKTNKKKYSSNYRRRTEPIFQRSQSPSSITPDSLENQKMPLRRVIRSPKSNKLQTSIIKEKRESSATDSKSNDPSKKPRTVHIDVYCTGTEMESSNSSNSSSSESTDNEIVSTPQTVFESKKVKITHKRANQHQLPHNIEKSHSDKNLKTKNVEKDESDDEDASTAYPSKLSSYSTIRDFSSSMSTVPRSWTNYSMSSCTVPDDYDSVANTSWKDTFSDIDSLLQSRSSIAQTDSLDFVPRKLYEKNPSIDETPEIENLLETPSNISLQASDSFEYANSEDRLRIKKMEELWRNKPQQQPNKSWKSPQIERKHMLQQKKIQAYLQKRLSDKNLPKWKSKDSDSEGSDDLETGWSFIENQNNSKIIKKEPEKLQIETPSNRDKSVDSKRSDSTSSLTKSPSLRQRLSLDPNLRAPFTILPGIYTEQRAVAKKFGSIVNAFRKPGHHVGPAKNPDCLCEHCQRYFETFQRNRTRSVGDTTLTNWKNSMLNPQTQSNSNQSVPSQLYTSYQ